MGTLHEIIEGIAKSIDGNWESAAVRASLGIAAALASGGAEPDAKLNSDKIWVDWAEWTRACACGGIKGGSSFFESLLEQAVAHGLAEQVEDGPSCDLPEGRWGFSTPVYVRALAEFSAKEEQWVRYHGVCARALLEQYGEGTHDLQGRVVAGRRAQHLIVARRVDEALEMFLVAQKVAMDSDDHEGCLGLLDRRESLLDQMGVAPRSPFRAQNDTRRARSYFLRGDILRAEELVQRGLKTLRRSDWAAETGYAMLLYARIRTGQYRYRDALRYNDDASGYLAVAGDEHGLTRARANKAYVMMLQGSYEAARRGMLRAVATFEDLEDRFMMAVMHNFIARTWLGDGNSAEATRSAERARAIARADGYRVTEGTTWMMLGEIARQAEQWDQARHRYVKALELYRVENNRPAYVARYNIALVEIGAHNFKEARPILLNLIMSYVEVGHHSKLPLLYAGLMTCAVGRRDWKAWEENLERFESTLSNISGAHEDIAWLAERALLLADAFMDELTTREEPVGDKLEIHRLFVLREQLFELACKQNDLLGNTKKLRTLQATFAAEGSDIVAHSS